MQIYSLLFLFREIKEVADQPKIFVFESSNNVLASGVSLSISYLIIWIEICFKLFHEVVNSNLNFKKNIWIGR